jgi:hypothetical protein
MFFSAHFPKAKVFVVIIVVIVVVGVARVVVFVVVVAYVIGCLRRCLWFYLPSPNLNLIPSPKPLTLNFTL